MPNLFYLTSKKLFIPLSEHYIAFLKKTIILSSICSLNPCDSDSMNERQNINVIVSIQN